MEKDILEKYRKAGTIHKECLEFGSRLIKPGEKILYVVEQIEEKIRNSGAGFAFPVNVSVNETAAHDTADMGDARVFKEGDLVKLDIGVQVDGYIADGAVTISLDSGKEDLIKASREALEAALKLMTPGRPIPEVSEAIEQTVRNAGFVPVRNLTGHKLERYSLHAGVEFPNIKTDLNYGLKEGDVFAIEPFVTDGSGKVVDTKKTLIYMFLSDRPTRFPESRKILQVAREDFHKLPFTKRWLLQKIPGLSPVKLNLILKQLEKINSLYEYPALREVAGGYVAQSEHTAIVKDKPVVTTA